MFKIGIGPSSSHTLGPMKIGKQFVDELENQGLLEVATSVVVDLYGSLSATGRGHNTDVAVTLGLAGKIPDTVDIDGIPAFLARVRATGRLSLSGRREVDFPEEAIRFNAEMLPLHENGMRITAYAGTEELYANTFYSIGGGFIVDAEHLGVVSEDTVSVPYPYRNAKDVLAYCERDGISISEMQWRNEVAARSEDEVRGHLRRIWEVMREDIDRGITTGGVLPGPLQVPRRAKALAQRILPQRNTDDPLIAMSWLNMYAMAVNEENAAGGRVVTSPTNGACGVCPAVMAYYDEFFGPSDEETRGRFFLTAAVIGALYKMNASLSAAEVGCQGEVGVASSMAAGAYAELRGATPLQVCSAAEIGMEHNLGLTCDPVNGQVQVPCIERNAMGAVKAVNAAALAMLRDTDPKVGLDEVIETMYETGKDMHLNYRETSLGGLARNVPCA